MRLDWRDATEPFELQDLEQFICTDPPRRRFLGGRFPYHPREWELDVQSHFRSRRLPVHRPEYLMLGYDQDRLAAAVNFCADGPEGWLVRAIARAQRYVGLGYGDEALDVALDRMRGFGAGEAVSTRIHPLNAPSKALFERHGFALFHRDPDGYEEWAREL